MPLDDVSKGYGDIYVVVDLLDTPELIEICSDDEELEDERKGNPKEDLEIGEPHP